MNRRVAMYVVVLALPLCLWASQSGTQSQSPQQSAPQDPNAAHFAYGGNAAQIPAQFLGNLIFLPAQLNGAAPSFFLLDSSAAQTSVEPLRNAQAGSEALAEKTLGYAVIRLPGVVLPVASLPIIEHKDFAPQYGQAPHGVLGLDFFNRVVVEINYYRQTVQLYDPAAFTYSGTGTSFPLEMSPAGPLVHGKFEVAGHKNYDSQFIVDTALDSSVVFFRAFTDSEKISSAHFKAFESSDPRLDAGTKMLLGRIKQVQLGPYTVQESIGAFLQQNLPGMNDRKIAGAIGGGLLRRFNVILDFPHNRMILEPNLSINTLEDADMSGLSIIATGANLRTFEVVNVQKGTPASDAGIQVGDVIAGLDDEPAADFTLTALREEFRQFGKELAGHQYKILLDRKGQTITVKLKMRRLV